MLEQMEKKDLNKKKKHKSKTFIENQKENEIIKLNSTFDFANLYTSAGETSITTSKKPKHKLKNDDISNKKRNKIESVEDTPILLKKKFPKSELNKLKTSTPNTSNDKHSSRQETSVKSIMKNNSTLDNDAIDESNEISTSFESGKRKKRTKSVSFMLDDGEEVSQKKSKPNKMELDSSNLISKKREKKNMKALDNNENSIKQLEEATLTSDIGTSTKKEKKKNVDVNVRLIENEFDNNNSSNKKKPKKSRNNLVSSDEIGEIAILNQANDNKKFIKGKKDKKKNAGKMTEGEIKDDNIDPIIEQQSNNSKYKKKYKHKISSVDVNKEKPDKTSRKMNEKAENVVDDLESLTIGDNAHTLTNLLDEMTVADKNKKNKRKKPKEAVVAPEDNLESDKKDKKDKDKWKKRKLHRKPEFRGNDVTTSVVVDNLPIKLLFDYRDLLREHFSKSGLIRRIGIAEVYPTEEPKPVFTTTVYFFSEEAATSALEEDNSAFHMGRMRVRRPLPPTETTLIIKCHAPLDESILSSVFLSCGRIRSIRKVEKSKKSISSAFIEFNGPEEVEKAIKLSSTLTIRGKKVYVAKFEIRSKKHEGGQKDAIKDEINEES